MNEKDIYKGLNHIDGDLIEEAANPLNNGRKPAGRRLGKIGKTIWALGTAAAVFTIFVLGNEVVRLNNELEKSKRSGTVELSDENNKTLEEGNAVYDHKGFCNIYKTLDDYSSLYAVVSDIDQRDKEMMEYDDITGGVAEYDMEDAKSESIGSMESGEDYSKTNVMTEGVDESDIVKTDGNYIYMIESGQISITDIRSGKPKDKEILIPEMESTSDEIVEMYVSEDNLVLMTNHYDNDAQGSETITYSYDVKDKKNPKLIGSSRQDGVYDTSRKINDTVYVFSNKYITTADMSEKEALSEDGLQKWVPKVNNTIIKSDCIFYQEESNNGMVVSSFDINSPEKTIDSKYVMSGDAKIYVSAGSIYFYRVFYEGRTITSISGMDFSDGKLIPGESETIRGSIRDSFAICQQKDYLYVLSTEDDSSTQVNTLHVFDSDMKQVGLINEIARGERIYAARFVGDYIYFITYRETDPLFVADISNPKKPEIIGELKVDGYSEYLHYWDENHILGIGYQENGTGDNDIKLTMFDVSNTKKPKEENSFLLKGNYYSTAIDGNYKGILADSTKNLIGFASSKDWESTVYELFTYDKKEGFSIIKETTFDINNDDAYRGLYVGDNFYIAGNSDITYFKLKK